MSTDKQRYVFTTFRYDEHLQAVSANGTPASCIYLLKHHFDRLNDAAAVIFGDAGPSVLAKAAIEDAAALNLLVDSRLSQQIEEARTSGSVICYRVRLQIDESSQVTIAATSVPRLHISSLFPRTLDQQDEPPPSWSVVTDRRSTSPSKATRCKIDDRREYDRARHEAGIVDMSMTCEVLLYNELGDIMDASITTPYFFRDGAWVTPVASCGGQQGTTRRWALAQGLCKEAVIKIDSLLAGEKLWLSNAARGFFTATVQHSPTTP